MDTNKEYRMAECEASSNYKSESIYGGKLLRKQSELLRKQSERGSKAERWATARDSLGDARAALNSARDELHCALKTLEMRVVQVALFESKEAEARLDLHQEMGRSDPGFDRGVCDGVPGQGPLG